MVRASQSTPQGVSLSFFRIQVCTSCAPLLLSSGPRKGAVHRKTCVYTVPLHSIIFTLTFLHLPLPLPLLCSHRLALPALTLPCLRPCTSSHTASPSLRSRCPACAPVLLLTPPRPPCACLPHPPCACLPHLACAQLPHPYPPCAQLTPPHLPCTCSCTTSPSLYMLLHHLTFPVHALAPPHLP